MRHQCESDCPPTDIDIWVMVFLFGFLGHSAHRIDAVEEGGKLDGAAQGAVGALPAGKVGQCGVYLVIR